MHEKKKMVFDYNHFTMQLFIIMVFWTIAKTSSKNSSGYSHGKAGKWQLI